MRHGPFILIALLAALAFGCASEPKPVSSNAAKSDGANRLADTLTLHYM